MVVQSAKAKAQQTGFHFSANYIKDAIWEDGLRDFFEYRDLGIRDATGGQVKAHIIRVRNGGDASDLRTTGMHVHELDFQMIYILRGWIKFVYEVPDSDGDIRREEHAFGQGDCYLQPPAIVNNEVECANDLELLDMRWQ